MSLLKVRNVEEESEPSTRQEYEAGKYNCSDAGVEGDLGHGFLRNCNNTEGVAKGKKAERSTSTSV